MPYCQIRGTGILLIAENERVENHRVVSYACWVQGEEREGKRRYPLVNPSTGKVFAQVSIADRQLVDSALTGAREALKEWRRVPAPQRSALLHDLAALIRQDRNALASLLSEEAGKPLKAALDEVLNTAFLMDYFAEENLRLTGQIPLLGYPREQVLIVREPVGVVVAITPFNYPLSTLAVKMAPALAVGCTLVAKPDEHTPLSTLKVAQMAVRAGLPPGVFNVLTGPGPETGRFLVEHPIPRLITFTGSTEVGKEIQAAGARWVRKAILELGGHCPAIVCHDASWRELLPQLVSQSMKNCGQYCYRISRIYVERKIYDEFLTAFVERVAALRIGPATDPFVELGPLNNADILTKVRQQVDTAVKEGARIQVGGSSPPVAGGGFYFSPTVLTGVTSEMSITKEEVFGPVVIVTPFEEFSEAIREANATPYGLAAYLFSKDLAKVLEGMERLEVGSVWVNRIHQAYPQAPFGGMKESGLGREKSRYGMEEFTELKTVYLSY